MGETMADENSKHGGPTRRGFGVILGGLAAGTILGTTVVAHAEEGERAGPDTTGAGSSPERKRQAHRWPVDRRDVASLGAKLDALDLSDNERVLLVGLLSVATDAIVRSGPDHSASPLVSTGSGPGPLIEVRTSAGVPSVRDQFRAAFIPGAVPLNDFEVEEIEKRDTP